MCTTARVKQSNGNVDFYVLAPGFISHVRPEIARKVTLYAGGKPLEEIDILPSELDTLLHAYGIPLERKDDVPPGKTWSWARTAYNYLRRLKQMWNPSAQTDEAPEICARCHAEITLS